MIGLTADAGDSFKKRASIPLAPCTYHCERTHSGMPSKPTSDLAEDCQVSTLGRWKLEEHVTNSALYNTDMYVPLWEDSQWYIMKPTSDLAEDCQVSALGRWKLEVYVTDSGYIILICTYHCERIHNGISWNLRQIWQRIARSDAGKMEMEELYYW